MKKIIIVGVGVLLVVTAAVWFLSRSKIATGAGVSGPAAVLLNQAKDLESKGNLLEAKNIYAKLINDNSSSPEVMNWQKKMEALNIKLIFSPTITPESISYEIKPGDTLNKIAKEFNTTTELIAKSNNLPSDKIIPGRKIKVWKAPFSIFVDKSENILLLKCGDGIFKTYIVSTGKNNSTPVGTYKIVNKLTNPTWFRSGAVVPPNSPDNVLGTRWMGFDLAGYGIHGTTEPENLGKQVTLGCVRMANPEVEELYTIVPSGTEVTIVD